MDKYGNMEFPSYFEFDVLDPVSAAEIISGRMTARWMFRVNMAFSSYRPGATVSAVCRNFDEFSLLCILYKRIFGEEASSMSKTDIYDETFVKTVEV